jgi:hypothetical protein
MPDVRTERSPAQGHGGDGDAGTAHDAALAMHGGRGGAGGAWIALAKSDWRRICDGVPERAGGLLLVWTELLILANEQGTLSPALTRARLAERLPSRGKRYLAYCLADLRELGLLTYDAPLRGMNGRAGPTVYHLKPAADPVCNPMHTVHGDDRPPIAQLSREQKGNKKSPLPRVTPGEAFLPFGPDASTGHLERRAPTATRKAARVDVNSATMQRIGAWFRRKPATLWSQQEAEALESLGAIDDDDLAVLERFYTAEIPENGFRRREVITLLNHWNGELDKARRWESESTGAERNIL